MTSHPTRGTSESWSLFLSSSGKKSLLDLDIYNGNKVEIGGICRSEDKGARASKNAAKLKPPQKKKNKNATGSKKKNPPLCKHVLSDKQLAERHKQAHSRSMNPVLEELSPKLKAIRNRLHGLNVKNTVPKVKRRNAKADNATQVTPTFPFEDEYNAKKAGKSVYPVLVGEVSSLQDIKVAAQAMDYP